MLKWVLLATVIVVTMLVLAHFAYMWVRARKGALPGSWNLPQSLGARPPDDL
jgi:hypothetical protein